MSPRFAFTPLPPTRGDHRRPSGLAAFAGTWRGELRGENGQCESFTLLRDASADSAVAGRFLFYVSHEVAPTGVRLLEASASSFVALIGPYYDPRHATEMVTVLEGVRRGDELAGEFYTRVRGVRDNVRSGRFVAVRAERTDRAA
ncbi:MAG: hypothetical protein ACT4OZ_03735 [Gemmatimonadota bacterium]